MRKKVTRENLSLAAIASLVLILPASAFAQQPQQNSYNDLSQYLVSGNQIVPGGSVSSGIPAGGLSSFVVQLGQGNAASAALNGTSNVTTQYQSGAGNSSTLSINGTQNAITTTQIGNANTPSSDVAGNGNSISNLQVGSGLSYQLQVIGKSAPVSVQQYGRK
jgi:hypothetical protein